MTQLSPPLSPPIMSLLRHWRPRVCSPSSQTGRPCSGQFPIGHYIEFRGQCRELSRQELDMALLGQLNAFTFSGENAVRHPTLSRQHTYAVFWHCGQRVCRKTFLFLHTISEKRLKNLKSSLSRNELTPRTHGNTRRLPANTITYADTQ